MSATEADVRDVRIRPKREKPSMECPECGHFLPIDQWTECERCGAHLSLKVAVEAPGIDP